jgi:hypothetical protein
MQRFVPAMREHLAKMRAMLLGLLAHSTPWSQHLPTWLQNIERSFDDAVEQVRATRRVRNQLVGSLGLDIVRHMAAWIGPHCVGVEPRPECALSPLFYPYCSAIPDMHDGVFYGQRVLLAHLYELVDICGPRLSDFQVRDSQARMYFEGSYCVGCQRRHKPCSVISLSYGQQVIQAELCIKCFRAFELAGNPPRSRTSRVTLPPWFDNQYRNAARNHWNTCTVNTLWKTTPSKKRKHVV